MRPGMAVRLAAEIRHALYGRRIGRNAVSHHKKCGPSAVRLQGIQDPCRILRRAVIKSQRNHRSCRVNALSSRTFRRLCAFSRYCYPETIHAESMSLGSRGLPVLHRSCPESVLIYRVINIIILRKLSGKCHADRFQWHICLGTSVRSHIFLPGKPAGSA